MRMPYVPFDLLILICSLTSTLILIYNLIAGLLGFYELEVPIP